MTELNPLYIISALIFGMVHAMEPGHGKSLVATFVLGTKTNKVRDAFLLGLIASVTHTASIYLIGFVGLKFLNLIPTEDKTQLISLIASIVIFLIGVWLMWDRIVEPLFHHEHEHDCSVHKIFAKNVKMTSAIMIGFTAGIIPCSGGLAVIMTATAVEGISNFIRGFFYVLSFSIGLGLALTLVAISMIYGKGLVNSIFQKSMSNIERSSGVISAILIYTLGLVLLTTNLTKTSNCEHHHEHSHEIHTMHF